MSLDATGAKNFYYYESPSGPTQVKTYPSGQKIWTQLPVDVAAIRIGAILAATTIFFISALKTPATSQWRFLVVIFGVTLAAWVAIKHLLTNDSLVEAFYKIAGGKENYEKLPEFPMNKDQKTYANFGIAWARLEHPLYRFSTSDGRKGLLVKGLRCVEEYNSMGIARTAYTRSMMVFVEKLGPCDIPIPIAGITERGFSIRNALHYRAWNNPFSSTLLSVQGPTGSYKIINGLYAYMPADWANKFIAQKGVVNQLKKIQKSTEA